KPSADCRMIGVEKLTDFLHRAAQPSELCNLLCVYRKLRAPSHSLRRLGSTVQDYSLRLSRDRSQIPRLLFCLLKPSDQVINLVVAQDATRGRDDADRSAVMPYGDLDDILLLSLHWEDDRAHRSKSSDA